MPQIQHEQILSEGAIQTAHQHEMPASLATGEMWAKASGGKPGTQKHGYNERDNINVGKTGKKPECPCVAGGNTQMNTLPTFVKTLW